MTDTDDRDLRQSAFCKALGISPRQLGRLAEDTNAGFLYQPTGEEPVKTPTGRSPKFWASWKVALIRAVRASRLSLEEAKILHDSHLITSTTPQTAADNFELPKRGRPRRAS